MGDKWPYRRKRRSTLVLRHFCLCACVWFLSVSTVVSEQPPPETMDAVRSDCLSGGWIDEIVAFVVEATEAAVPSTCIRQPQGKSFNLLADLNPSHAVVAAAAYLPASGNVLLAADLDFHEHLARSYLVHELVHAQQFALGRNARVPCRGHLENEAYSIQARYLIKHGLTQEAFLFQLMGLLQASCSQEY